MNTDEYEKYYGLLKTPIVIVANETDEIVFFNESFAEFCALKEDTLLKKHIEKLCKKFQYKMHEIGEVTLYEFQDRKRDVELRLLRNAIDQSPYLIVITDVKGNIQFANPAFFTRTGYGKEEIIGKNAGQLGAYYQKDIYKDMWKKIANKQIWDGEFANKDKEGNTFFEKARISPVLGSNGKITHFIKIADDVTEYKTIQADLKSKTDELVALNRNLQKIVNEEVEKNQNKEKIMMQQSRFAQMGEMLSMIAHQWRQPLNAISASTIKLRFDKDLDMLTDENFETQTEFIEEQAKKMSQTIDEFMNFFKPAVQSVDFSVNRAVVNVEKMIGAQLQNREIELQNLLGEEVMVHGIQSEFEHVLLNLISNARDAFEGKSIEHKLISVKAESEHGKSIIVCDNAGGIPESVIERIFDPYFTTKEQGKGTGIGLYMTKTILQRNFNATIKVHNNEEGACFTMSFD